MSNLYQHSPENNHPRPGRKKILSFAPVEQPTLAAVRVARKFGLPITTAILVCRLAHLGTEGGING